MQTRLSWIWLVPVLLITTYLGTVLLTYDAIWFDEWITYFITNTGRIGADPAYYGATPVDGLPVCEDLLSPEYHYVLHTICIAALDNSWPPLFFLMLMGWDAILGGELFVDRILALFIGLVGVSLTYRMVTEMIDRKTGIIAALLLGTTVFFTFYLHEVRGYTLYVTLPALNGWLYWRLLKNPHAGRVSRYGFALSIVGTLYTHYIGLAVIFGIGLYHVLLARPQNLLENLRLDEAERPDDAHTWLTILKLYINGCLTYGLWVAVLYISFVNESLNPRSVSTLSLLWSMLAGFSNNLWFLALPAIGLSLFKIRDDAVRFLWVWGLSILGVAILGNIAADFLFHPRHIMGLMPAFATLVAIGLIWIGNRTTDVVMWGLVAGWVGAGIFYGSSVTFMNNIPQHIDAVPSSAMETITNTAETCGTEDDLFVFVWNTPDEEWVQDHVVTYYLFDTPVQGVTLSRIITEEVELENLSSLMPEDVANSGTDARYEYFVADSNRVFVFKLPEVSVDDTVQEFENRLNQDGFVKCPYLNRDDLVADIFVRDGETCENIALTCN